MCGRYVLATTLKDLEIYYRPARIVEVEGLPCYNVAPSMTMPVVGIGEDGRRGIAPLVWGFRPHWAKADAHTDQRQNRKRVRKKLLQGRH